MADHRSHLDHRLTRFVERARVDCDHLFEYRCPMYWGNLVHTDDAEVRYCGECSQNVYLVTTEAELAARARRGECVAIIAPTELPTPAQAMHADFPLVAAVGRPAPPSRFDTPRRSRSRDLPRLPNQPRMPPLPAGTDPDPD